MFKGLSNIFAVLCLMFGVASVVIESDVLISMTGAMLIFTLLSSFLGKGSKKKENKKLKRMYDQYALQYFSEYDELKINEHIVLKLNGALSFDEVSVYYNDEKVGVIGDFKETSSVSYKKFQEVLAGQNHKQEKVVEPVYEHETTSTSYSLASYYDQINDLNLQITHQKITEDLYHTVTMLKFIENIIKQYPNKADKLDKLESYYLPTLITILKLSNMNTLVR